MKTQQILIVCPVFNEWTSVEKLLEEIDGLEINKHVGILLINDGSTEAYHNNSLTKAYQAIQSVQVLPLRRNLGHQRAIAIGLAYADAHLDFDCVIVMDSDGEDRPSDIPKLLEAVDETENSKIIFAKRKKRSESLLFKLSYYIYLISFWLLTGSTLRVGNFSTIPKRFIRSLVNASELWMNYPSSILKLRLPYSHVPADRGSRYDGQSKMSFMTLVLHGLQAIAIHRERVGVRIIIFSLGSIIILLLAILTVVIIRMFTELAIPGWASNLVGIFTILLIQIVGLSLFFIFLVLGSRSIFEFIPSRDFPLFTDDAVTVYQREQL